MNHQTVAKMLSQARGELSKMKATRENMLAIQRLDECLMWNSADKAFLDRGIETS